MVIILFLAHRTEVTHQRAAAGTDPHHGHVAVRVSPPDQLHLGLRVPGAAHDVEVRTGEIHTGVASPVKYTAPPASRGRVPHVVTDFLN